MKTETPKPRIARATAFVAVLSGLAGVCGLSGCRGDRSDAPPRQFFPDMDDQMKWKPQSGSGFFADGRTMRPAVPGAVPFGRSSVLSDEAWFGVLGAERARLLREDDELYRGVGPDGRYVERIPVDKVAAMLGVERAEAVDRLLSIGQQRYSIYCAVCHGALGNGKGMVGAQWSYDLPSFHDPKYSDPNEPDGKNRDGFLFHTARNGVLDAQGVEKMPGYAHALDEVEAWGVVAYIRALQESRRGTPADVPEAERQRLENQRGAAPATGGAS